MLNIDNGTGAISTFFKTAITGFTGLINSVSDFNTVSSIVGDGEDSNWLERLMPATMVATMFSNSKRMGVAVSEFKAITEEFNKIDPLDVNIDQIQLQ